MNIAIYARKSVFSDKSDSIEAQIKLCKEYAEINYKGLIIVYSDEGFTGANTQRPGFAQLMKDIHNKKIDVLICYKIDRISRNVMDFSKIFNSLQEHNTQFVSLKEQIDTSTPLGRAMMYICSVFAQMERETIAERVKDNLTELAKSGKWAGGKPPIGYKRKRVMLNGKNHTMLMPNENEIPFLNMIYDTFLQGYSLARLETYFKNKGVKTLQGNYLSGTQLYNMLKNPHYVAATPEVCEYFADLGCIIAADKDKFDGKHGLVVYGRTTGGKNKKHSSTTPDNWIVSIGLHDPIMPSDKWLSVQKCFGNNVIDKTRKHEVGILKGLLKCKCRCTMRVNRREFAKYGKVYEYYYCVTRNRKGLEYCDMDMINVDKLDNKLIDILKEISIDKNLLYKYINQKKPEVPTRDKIIIEKEIVGIQKKIDNLTATLQDNASSTAAKYIISQIEKLDNQLAGLNFELREVEYKKERIKKEEATIDIIYNKICNYVSIFDTLTYIDKVKFLKEIIKGCIWDGKNLHLNF